MIVIVHVGWIRPVSHDVGCISKQSLLNVISLKSMEAKVGQKKKNNE